MISDVSSGDAGTYECHLTNGPGSTLTKTFHVTVNGKTVKYFLRLCKVFQPISQNREFFFTS